ncbi:MAG TPA: site-specific integrase [Pseudoxanthomonas sp.]
MPLVLTKRIATAAQPQERPYELRDTTVRGLILRVQPSGYKAWIIQWAWGKRRTLGQFGHLTLEQARAHAALAMAEVIQQGLPSIAKAKPATCTLSEFLDDHYAAWVVSDIKTGKRSLQIIRTAFPDFQSRQLNTGLRRGELLSLFWNDVDLVGKMITVRAERAKSGRQRHVPLNIEALGVLTRWRGQCDDRPGIFQPNDVKTAWVKLLGRAKITNCRFHDLRHHFASRLVTKGVDLNTVRELLGHADIKMTLRYAHLAPDHLAAAVEKLAA